MRSTYYLQNSSPVYGRKILEARMKSSLKDRGAISELTKIKLHQSYNHRQWKESLEHIAL
jgi:hypothetical protein